MLQKANNMGVQGLSILQIFTASFIVITITELLYLYYRKIESGEATLLILIWLVHALIFYMFLSLKNIGWKPVLNHAWNFTDWSSALRFHTYLTVMCYLTMRIIRHRLFDKFTK